MIKKLLKLLIKSVNFSYKKSVGGISFIIPVRNGVGPALRLDSEPWMIELIERYQKDGMVFVDVGANIGQTLLKLRSVSKCDYLGFEPNSICCSYLSELIVANGIKSTEIIPCGLSLETGVMELHFFTDSTDDSCASLVSVFRDQEVKGSAFISALKGAEVESLLSGRQLGVLKIDVEGGEVEVLESMESVIAKHQPVILLEVLPSYSKENTIRIERQNRIEQLCKRLSYQIFRVKKDGDHKLVAEHKIETFGVHCDLECCDYVLKPAS